MSACTNAPTNVVLLGGAQQAFMGSPSQQKVEPKELREKQALARSQLLRGAFGWLTEPAFRQRKAYFSAKVGHFIAACLWGLLMEKFMPASVTLGSCKPVRVLMRHADAPAARRLHARNSKCLLCCCSSAAVHNGRWIRLHGGCYSWAAE